MLRKPDGVDRIINAISLLCHRPQVPFDRLLVKRIDQSSRGCSSCIRDPSGHLLDRSKPPTCQEHLCPLTGEGTGNRATHSSSCSINHRTFVLKYHIHSPISFMFREIPFFWPSPAP